MTGSEWNDDDTRLDVYALFILKDAPHSTINEVLQKNADDMQQYYFLWPADSYRNLPRITNQRTQATKSPIDPDWTSPFLGKDLEDAARFVKKAPKPLCRVYFAVLEKERYERDGMIRLCKIVDGEVLSFFYTGVHVTLYFIGHDRDAWEDDLEDFRDFMND